MPVAPWQMSTPVAAASINGGSSVALPTGGVGLAFSPNAKKTKAPKDTGVLSATGEQGAAGPQMPALNDVESTTGQMGAAGPVEPFANGGNVHDHFHNYFSGGGKAEGRVPAMVSPGEVYLSPEKVRAVIHEGADPMKIGEHIGGKAKKKNDSLKNDIVPKTLEEGGVVIPRHITTHKMAADKAALFVHRAMAKKKARG